MTYTEKFMALTEDFEGYRAGRDPRTIDAEVFAKSLPDAPVGLRAIRAKCVDCCGGQTAEVRRCTAVDCALWPMRMGVMPRGLREVRGYKAASDEGDAE